MVDPTFLLFIHGSESSSRTYKATLLRRLFPGMLTPDFTGSVQERMAQLEVVLGTRAGWTLIGSSLGGLMAALYAARNPDRVRKLILLAPALLMPEFSAHPPTSIPVPTVIIHGRRDEVVPLVPTRRLAEKVFPQLKYLVVEDDHRLHDTAKMLDWVHLVE